MTFGGGQTMQYGFPEALGSERKYPRCYHSAYHCGSTRVGS